MIWLVRDGEEEEKERRKEREEGENGERVAAKGRGEERRGFGKEMGLGFYI